jgi:hypothetical protein
MSAAKKWEWEWTVPPGYRGLADILREYGRARAQTKLISGEWPAFELDLDTGDLRPISATTWCVYHGRSLLDRAENPNDDDGGEIYTNHWFVVIVRMSERPPPQPQRASPQADRIDQVIAKHFPDGTDGISPKTVHRAVVKELKPDSEKRGLAVPSLTSVKRRMGRRK